MSGLSCCHAVRAGKQLFSSVWQTWLLQNWRQNSGSRFNLNQHHSNSSTAAATTRRRSHLLGLHRQPEVSAVQTVSWDCLSVIEQCNSPASVEPLLRGGLMLQN